MGAESQTAPERSGPERSEHVLGLAARRTMLWQGDNSGETPWMGRVIAPERPERPGVRGQRWITDVIRWQRSAQRLRAASAPVARALRSYPETTERQAAG